MVTDQVTALIKVEPAQDRAIQALYNEAIGLKFYAESRIITKNEDLKTATEDLSIIAKLKKAIEERKKEYTGPIRSHLNDVNQAFESFLTPLNEADQITRQKVMAFRTEQARKIKEAEDIQAEKEALARREAELNQGKTTIDLTPVVAPPMVPQRVRTDLGMIGTMKVYKWEPVDITLIPRDYLRLDFAMISSVVKATKGQITIPGIRIWEEETLRVTTAP